ncbi:MAG: hypothetical protein Q3M24_07895 [Candidatus Electrothrix aestuarii]|uniref:Uncharacterized protein n=1 Tax=Candidatus Electrothrix aestuarii TaxID=3062594 RepID=A0AAU8LZK0_9BACT
MKKFFASIPVKICLAVLGIETLLLAIMGVYYARKLCEEVDRNLSNKVSMPATLLSEQVLNLDSGLSLELFEKLLQEKIHDVFIVKPDGIIDYSADPEQRDSYYESYLDEEERKQFQKNNQNFSETQIVSNQYKGKTLSLSFPR